MQELSRTMSLAGNFVSIAIINMIFNHFLSSFLMLHDTYKKLPYSTFRLNKNRDPINDTVVDLLKKSKTCTLMNEIYMDHPGQTKEEEDLPPQVTEGERRGWW